MPVPHVRWGRSFIPTLKENPQEAQIKSHRLMLRAGMIRKLASGTYSYLPLGLRALQKATAIVRQEMNGAGALELLLPALHPAEIWKETGRYEIMGEDAQGKLKGRHKSTGIGRPRFWDRARYYNEEHRLAAALDASDTKGLDAAG